MISRPGGVYWHILQTHQAAEVAFNRFLRPSMNLPFFRSKSESEKWIEFEEERFVFFKSGENYQDLRVETLDGCIIDEVRQQAPELWSQVIRPMLARRKGWCDFLSTPNGFDHFFDLYEAAKSDTTGEWAAFQSPSTEAWWWTPEEIASVKATMTEPEFAQEILAEFRDITRGKVYLSHGPHNWLDHTPFPTTDPEHLVSDRHPIVLGLDYNVNPMSWHLGQFDRTKWYWFDEIHIPNTNTQESSKILVERLLDIKGRGLMRSNPSVIVCGDATGKAMRTAASQSDYDILLGALKDAGISFRNETPEANPGVKDRVSTMNARLKAADGSITCFYNPKRCPKLKMDFDRTLWKADGILDPGPDKQLTHASDSVSYPIIQLSPLTGAREVGGLRVIIR